jgi:hypothetical protein
MHAHPVQPFIVEHRTPDEVTAGRLVEERPTQLDDLRLVQSVPFHPAVVNPIEAGVESAVQVDRHPVGCCVRNSHASRSNSLMRISMLTRSPFFLDRTREKS